MRGVPFRLGATSYSIPANLIDNARYLANVVDDVELVLFDTADGQSNIPSAGEIDSLQHIAADSGLTYTVHLPHDLQPPAAGADNAPSLTAALRLIELTRPLQPYAFIAHLHMASTPAQITPVVRQIGAHLPAATLAIENLEFQSPQVIESVVLQTAASRCVDVGHLWLAKQDPLPHLLRAMPLLRVVHLHGVAGRDHVSLAHTAPDRLDPVIRLLCEHGFGGVVTLEVFETGDFETSLTALLNSIERVR